MVAKENAIAKVRIAMKVITTKMALEIIAHATRVVAFVQVELRKRKTTNALGFFEAIVNFCSFREPNKRKVLET